LVLWDSKGRLRTAVEVKKDGWNCYEDLVRLTRLLNRGLEFSVIASCRFEDVKGNNVKAAEDRLEIEIQAMKKGISDDNEMSGLDATIELVESNIVPLTIKGKRPEDDEKSVWRPIIFKICREENRE
jgi:hypothetical protein